MTLMKKVRLVLFAFLIGTGSISVYFWTGSLLAAWVYTSILVFIGECIAEFGELVDRRMNMLLEAVERGQQDLSLLLKRSIT